MAFGRNPLCLWGVALWLAWLLYWYIGTRGLAENRRKLPQATSLPYRVPLVLGIVLIACPPLLPGSFGRPLYPTKNDVVLLGLATQALGLAFSVWARLHLGRLWSGTITLKEGHRIVESGPYGWVRHPIYTGLILAFFGTAVSAGTPQAFLGFLAAAFAYVRKLRLEEGWLSQNLGPDYDRYKSRVKALVPGVW